MKASLSPERWNQVQRLFDEVVDLEPAMRRIRLDEACRDDPALREEVETLLAAYAEADDLLYSLDQLAPRMPSFESALPLRTGTNVAHYEVLEKIGSGGMGVVYKAFDTRLKRTVALKFLPPQLSTHDAAKARFRQEAQAASALDHQHICTIYEIGEAEDGQTFIAMAYYEGETLKQKIARGPLPLEEALDYVVQIARGLATAHAAGIIHRDVKPANVMVTRPAPAEASGVVKILDFGLAKITDVQLTQTGTMMGTVAYMSPEQARGEGVDHRTDIWALGVILYEMLTGTRPFKGDYEQAIIYGVLNETPEPITASNAEMPEALEHVVALCLEKEHALRYPSMADLLVDLEVFARDTDVSLNTVLRTMMRRRKTRRMILAGITAFTTLLLLLTALLLWQTLGPGRTTAPATRGLAVLPLLNNLDETPENQALADGLMQSLAGMIARLEPVVRTLWVVPAEELVLKNVVTASDAYTMFGVDQVIRGSVQRLGSETELILNLIDAHPDRTHIIDSRTIRAPLGAAFREEVEQAVAHLLGVSQESGAQPVRPIDDPTTPDAYAFYLQGLGFLQRYDKAGNLDNAIRLFTSAIEEDSLYSLAYAGLCEASWESYEATKDRLWVDRAIDRCEHALSLNDQLAPVHVTMGRVLFQTGKNREAEAELQRALALEPENTDAYRWLGWVYSAQGKAADAEEAYKKAVALKPNYWLTYSHLGTFFFYEGRLEEAGPQYEQIIRLTPDNYIGYNNLGIQRLDIGQEAEARRLLEHSLALRPNDFAYLNLGRLHYRNGRYEDAAQMYEEALALKDNDFDNILLLLGEAYYWAGHEAKARSTWQRYFEIAGQYLAVNPNEKELLGRLAATHAALGDPEQSRTYIGRLFALPPPNAYTFHYVGRAYELLGDRDLALRYLARALDEGLPPIRIQTDPWLEALREDPGYQALR